jgi:precorrin-2 dehydrogenase/sirohydrochlorin ferrochelatase
LATLFPISLDLHGKRVTVIGGGEVALRKVELLLGAGAAVTVVSPEVCPQLAALGGIELRQRPFRPDDLGGCRLAIAATDQPDVNLEVCREARERGVLVNVVDQPELCDFHVPASIRRGRLCVAISTGGASPALAQRLRRELEAQFPSDYAQFASLLGEMRREIIARVQNENARRELFVQLASDDLFRLLKASGEAAARAEMLKRIDASQPR